MDQYLKVFWLKEFSQHQETDKAILQNELHQKTVSWWWGTLKDIVGHIQSSINVKGFFPSNSENYRLSGGRRHPTPHNLSGRACLAGVSEQKSTGEQLPSLLVWGEIGWDCSTHFPSQSAVRVPSLFSGFWAKGLADTLKLLEENRGQTVQVRQCFLSALQQHRKQLNQ